MSTSKYPLAVDLEAVGDYAALAKAGGGYFYDEVLEYRVWAWDAERREDYFCAFPNYEDALEFASRTDDAKDPLVLIRQLEYVDEPEPGELYHIKEERIAEWLPEWLDRGPRQEGAIEAFIAEKLAANKQL